MITIPIDIMIDGYFYATYHYKHCPAFTIRMQDVEQQVMAKYPSVKQKALKGHKVVLAMDNN